MIVSAREVCGVGVCGGEGELIADSCYNVWYCMTHHVLPQISCRSSRLCSVQPLLRGDVEHVCLSAPLRPSAGKVGGCEGVMGDGGGVSVAFLDVFLPPGETQRSIQAGLRSIRALWYGQEGCVDMLEGVLWVEKNMK